MEYTHNTATNTTKTQPNDAQPLLARQKPSHTKLLTLLGLASIAMFGFAIFILPPMYEVFCEITGLNGKSDSLERKAVVPTTGTLSTATLSTSTLSESTPSSKADPVKATVKPITIQFLADKHKNIPWTFEPTVFSMKLEPGKRYHTTFNVKNLTGETITGQAVPSVSPGYMAQYLKKMECFCFSQQTLEGFEEKEMPLSFSIAENAPSEVSTLTLSYMLYNVNDEKASESSVN